MSSLIPTGSTDGPQGATPPSPLPAKQADALAAMIKDFAEAASMPLRPHQITQSTSLEALARSKTVHYAELKGLVDHQKEPEVQKKLAALSIPYLSCCSQRLVEALHALKNTTDVPPFLQL